MRVNPDILETQKYQAIAREFIAHCELDDISYADTSHYTLLHVFSKSIIGESVNTVRTTFPKTVAAMAKIHNNYRQFDWPSLAIVVDSLRGRPLLSFDTP